VQFLKVQHFSVFSTCTVLEKLTMRIHVDDVMLTISAAFVYCSI